MDHDHQHNHQNDDNQHDHLHQQHQHQHHHDKIESDDHHECNEHHNHNDCHEHDHGHKNENDHGHKHEHLHSAGNILTHIIRYNHQYYNKGTYTTRAPPKKRKYSERAFTVGMHKTKWLYQLMVYNIDSFKTNLKVLGARLVVGKLR